MEKKINEKDVQEFVRLLPKLDPEEIVGCAKLLGVRMSYITEDKQPVKRSGEEILEDMIINFGQLARGDRRNLLREVKRATKRR